MVGATVAAAVAVAEAMKKTCKNKAHIREDKRLFYIIERVDLR